MNFSFTEKKKHVTLLLGNLVLLVYICLKKCLELYETEVDVTFLSFDIWSTVTSWYLTSPFIKSWFWICDPLVPAVTLIQFPVLTEGVTLTVQSNSFLFLPSFPATFYMLILVHDLIAYTSHHVPIPAPTHLIQITNWVLCATAV